MGLAVSFKGPNVMLGLYKCNYSLTRGMDRGPGVCYLCYRWYYILSALSSRSKNAVVVSLLGDTEIDGWVGHGQVRLVHSLKGLSNGFKSHWSLLLETLLLEFAKH